jgi:hypothetical protein
MSEQPPPQVSPDGRFYWDGQAWQPVTGAAPAPASEPKVLSSLPGIKLTLYPNRLEIEHGVLMTKKNETILLKAVTDVSAPAFVNRVTITTSDGKKHTYNVGNAKAVKEAILGNL